MKLQKFEGSWFLSSIGIAQTSIPCTYFHIPFYLLYGRVNVYVYEKVCNALETYNLLHETNLITQLEKFDGSRNPTKYIHIPNNSNPCFDVLY